MIDLVEGRHLETDLGTLDVVWRTEAIAQEYTDADGVARTLPGTPAAVALRYRDWPCVFAARLKPDGSLVEKDVAAIVNALEVIWTLVGPMGEWPPTAWGQTVAQPE